RHSLRSAGGRPGSAGQGAGPQAGTEADQPEHQGSGARRGSNRTGGTHKHRVESHPGRRDRGPAAPSEISRDREKPTFGSAEAVDKEGSTAFFVEFGIKQFRRKVFICSGRTHPGNFTPKQST